MYHLKSICKIRLKTVNCLVLKIGFQKKLSTKLKPLPTPWGDSSPTPREASRTKLFIQNLLSG